MENKQFVSFYPSQEQYQFLYEVLAATFPLQNGDVAAAPATVAPPAAAAAAGDTLQIVNEMGHTEGEWASSATTPQQQVGAVASTPPAENQEEAAKTTPDVTVEPASNGSTVTMEV